MITKNELQAIMTRINDIEYRVLPSDYEDDYTTKSISVKKHCASMSLVKDYLKNLHWEVRKLYDKAEWSKNE